MGVTARCTMIGYLSQDIQQETFKLLQEWTNAPCELIDNTEKNLPLTSLWNKILRESTADVHVLLNADVWVTPGWLDHLLPVFEDPTVAAAGPGSSHGNNYIDVGHWMARPPTKEWLGQVVGRVRDRYEDCTPWDKDINGFCYAVNREIWEALGGFDEAIPLYGNETEYNKRARHHGFQVLKVPQSYVWHWGSYSTNKKSTLAKRLE